MNSRRPSTNGALGGRVWRPADSSLFHDYDHPEFPGVAQATKQLGLAGRQHAGLFIWQAPQRS